MQSVGDGHGSVLLIFFQKKRKALLVSGQECNYFGSKAIFSQGNPQPMSMVGSGTRAGHFCPVQDTSNGQSLFWISLSRWLRLCQICFAV